MNELKKYSAEQLIEELCSRGKKNTSIDRENENIFDRDERLIKNSEVIFSLMKAQGVTVFEAKKEIEILAKVIESKTML